LIIVGVADNQRSLIGLGAHTGLSFLLVFGADDVLFTGYLARLLVFVVELVGAVCHFHRGLMLLIQAVVRQVLQTHDTFLKSA